MPPGGPPPPNPEKEALKAQVELQLMETVMPALEEILTPPDDGVVQLKAQELQIREQENQDDKEIAEKKLALDKAKLTGTFLEIPKREDITEPINEQLVVELYSK